jgi:two-component system chemotaxis response regulator CheB
MARSAHAGPARGRRDYPGEAGFVGARPALRDMVLVGASGGEGLRQLIAFLAALPAALPASVLVVLHRPIGPQSYLQSVLGNDSRLPVRIAEHLEQLEHGVCYIGEPALHLAVGPGPVAELYSDHVFQNRTIDLLFSAGAKCFGPRVIGIVFSGALSDGSEGLRQIAQAGGAALILDPEAVAQWDMPANALAAVPEAEVLRSPELIARRVVELTTGIGRR